MCQLVGIWYTVLVLWILPSIKCQYDIMNAGAYGVRISANDQFSVDARNNDFSYLLYLTSFDTNHFCLVPYQSQDHYVYSVAVIRNVNTTISNKTYQFLQVGENMSDSSGFLSVVTVQIDTEWKCTVHFSTIQISNVTHQQYMFVKVDPQNRYGYVFSDSFLLSFDINEQEIVELVSMNSLPKDKQFLTRAFDLSDRCAIVASLRLHYGNYYSTVLLMQLRPFRIIRNITDNGMMAKPYTTVYDFLNDLSISFSSRHDKALVGFPRDDQVWLLAMNVTSVNANDWTIELINSSRWSTQGIGFGRSVFWIDDQTIGVAVFAVPNRPWSISELWIFNVNRAMTVPMFVFPNNQQTFEFTLEKRPLFLHTIFASGYLYILTDLKFVVIYRSSSAGYASVSLTTTPPLHFVSFIPKPCIAGTYKNESGFGPCIVCPPQTMNPANGQNTPCTQCTPCDPTSFCPLGSTSNISLDVFPSYTQSFSYPDTPDINNYDDLLMQNIFTIDQSSRCLILSPTFWTLIVVILCFFVWIMMTLLKSRRFKPVIRHRNNLKKFLKHADIIKEGEQWIGGLFSFAAFVLIGFSYWFASAYFGLYPIETSASMSAACDNTLRNALFTSSLQLPLPSVTGQRWPIFDMLDQQVLTLTVDLINTRALCSNITVQMNQPNVNYLLIPVRSYSYHDSNNATQSVIFDLPSDPVNIQINITGSYFIGAIRLCLRGPSHEEGMNRLRSLDVCQLYSTANQTIGFDVTVPIVLIKTINQTKPLNSGSGTLYDGRWTPTWGTASGLSDKLVYEQNGEYLRYASIRTTISITLVEQPVFLQNIQQPIIQKAELAFHTLIFTTLIIELFALSFLIVKLAVRPFTNFVFRCWCQRKRAFSTEDTSSSLTSSSSKSYSDQTKATKSFNRRSLIWSLGRRKIHRHHRHNQLSPRQINNDRFVDDNNNGSEQLQTFTNPPHTAMDLPTDRY